MLGKLVDRVKRQRKKKDELHVVIDPANAQRSTFNPATFCLER
jgi:hypothetical protein